MEENITKPWTALKIDRIMQCNVCGTRYENHIGSTPCCGAIAYILDDQGNKTRDFRVYSSYGEMQVTTKLKTENK